MLNAVTEKPTKLSETTFAKLNEIANCEDSSEKLEPAEAAHVLRLIANRMRAQRLIKDLLAALSDLTLAGYEIEEYDKQQLRTFCRECLDEFEYLCTK